MPKTQKYFGTDGIRGRVGEFPLVPDFLTKLGWAVGQRINKGTVLIGKDTRLSGYMIEAALTAGLTAAGCNVLVTGPIPTPAVAFLSKHLPDVTLGIMISASHNPYQDNGVKLFCHHGFKLPDQIEQSIEETMQEPMQSVPAEDYGKVERLSTAKKEYIEHCLNAVSKQLSLDGLHIVLDCAHGATYHVAPIIFEKLGAKLTLIGHQPDGININNGVGSTAPQKLQETVLDEKADLGIAFDGDGDRVAMVNEKGELLDGDDILYIILKGNHLQGGIVGTLMTNLSLELAVRNTGLEFCRANVGDRYVLEKLKQNNWTLGGENSGHIIDLAVTTTGDGIVSALLALSCLVNAGTSLSKLTKDFNKCPQVLINIAVSQKPQALDNPQLLQEVETVEQALGDRGRVLLRLSGTEPVIRVMVEGTNEQEVNHFAEQLAGCVRQCYA